MISKKIALFAIGSMFAAGATLASNVTFGQRAVRWVAESFDFVGPMGAALGVVRAPEYDRKAPIMGFQVGSAAGGSVMASSGQPLEIAAYDPKYGLSRQALAVRALNDQGKAVGTDGASTESNINLAGKIRFSNIVGDNASSINNLAKSFLRNGSLVDEKDVLNLSRSIDPVKGGFTGAIGGLNPISTDSSDVISILAAATNGNPLVSGGVTGQTNTANQTVTPSTAVPTAPATGTVPVPGVLGLMAIGLAAWVSSRRR